MGPSHMVSMGFVSQMDCYPGVVSDCLRGEGGWLVVVRVESGGSVTNYSFVQSDPWPIGSPAVVSVTTGADGKVSQSVARPV